MTAWLAVLAVAGGSYAFRFLPVALAARWVPSPAMEHRLRIGAMSAIAALAAGSLRSPELTGSTPDAVATAAAVVAAVAVARTGRSLAFVVAAGLAVHTAVLAIA